MSKAAYWQRGESLDYKNSGTTKIEANTIIELGSHVAVAGTEIAAGEIGTVLVTGVYEMPKSSTNEIAVGTTVYFDGTGITEAADDGASSSKKYYPLAGYAADAATASETKILVKLLG